MSDRVILHCDCNSFFASCEIAVNPFLANVPMAVCGNEEHRHGIVLAKNDIAKQYGIVTAETVFSAKKKCPLLVTVPPHYDLYVKYSKAVSDIYAKYTDIIESFGIDESWLDVTSSTYFGTGREIAESIRKSVRSEVGITVSIGVSYNKVFAKLGSDYKKPDAVTVIDRANFKDIVYPLPVGDLLYVGNKTCDELFRMGIFTIGDLAHTAKELLTHKFGRLGEMLSKYSRGEDDSPVSPVREDDVKSIGNGFTFKHDLKTPEECRSGIDYLTVEIGAKLRRLAMKCSAVAVSIKDEFLHTIQRQKQLSAPSNDTRIIAEAAYELLMASWQYEHQVRTITVTAINLVKSDFATEQIDFFGNNNTTLDDKRKKVETALDEIRHKYGTDSIVSASVIGSDIGLYNNSSSKKNKKT